MGGVTAPFLVAALVGWFLPRDHRVTRAVTLRLGPQTVWETVANLDRLPSWWLMVRSVERLPDVAGRTRYRQTFANKRGRDEPVELEVAKTNPPMRLVTRITDERSSFQGRWTYAIEPAGPGSRVSVTEEGTIRNPLVRFFFRTMMSKTFFVDSYLRALGQKFGETVEPRSSPAVVHEEIV